MFMYQMFDFLIFQQVFQRLQQIYVFVHSIQFSQQNFQSSQLFFQSISQQSSNTMFNITTTQQNVERHTRFLNVMIKFNKIFKISCIVVKSNVTIVQLNKRYIQTNQNSDMNVMSTELVRHLEFQLHSFEKIDFKNLSMRTIDHKEIVLHY